MNRLQLKTNPACLAEKRYVVDWVFGDQLGIEFDLEPSLDQPVFQIGLANQPGQLTLAAQLFDRLDSAWLQAESFPAQDTIGLVRLDEVQGRPLVDDLGELPDLMGIAAGPLTEAGDGFHLQLDLLGTIFVMLSGYQETTPAERDEHDRFTASSSWMAQLQLLERPIVDELVAVLWALLDRLWPGLSRRQHSFRLLPSHDIDLPSLYARSGWMDIGKHLVGPVLRRFDLARSFRRWRDWSRFRRGDIAADPYDCLDWLMDQAEAARTTSTFYYIPETTDQRDPALPLDHPVVIDQWRRIARREHRIGVHPGYQTYRSSATMQSGIQRFRAQRGDVARPPQPLTSRQHYLRWSTPETARLLDEAGVAEDATLGFADRIGFRCGTSHRFPMYDLTDRRPLSLWQQPLIAMECSVLDERYMGLGLTAEAHDRLVSLKQQCRRYGGAFSLLWHNTELQTESRREFYTSVLQS